MKPFSKPAIDIPAQLALLKQRGLTIQNVLKSRREQLSATIWAQNMARIGIWMLVYFSEIIDTKHCSRVFKLNRIRPAKTTGVSANA